MCLLFVFVEQRKKENDLIVKQRKKGVLGEVTDLSWDEKVIRRDRINTFNSLTEQIDFTVKYVMVSTNLFSVLVFVPFNFLSGKFS